MLFFKLNYANISNICKFFTAVYVTSKNISALSRRKGVTPIIIQRRIDKREVRRPTIEIKGMENIFF